jgi:phosphatidate phosphatase APP1
MFGQKVPQSTQPDVGLGRDEHVVFVRTYGRPSSDEAKWDLKVAGRIWKGNGIWMAGAGSSGFREVLGKSGILFVRDVSGRHLTIQLGGFSDNKTSQRPPSLNGRQRTVSVASNAHGEFVGDVVLTNEDVLRFSEDRGQPDWHITYGLAGSTDKDSRDRVYLCQGSGISVISDIDDTIKDTHVWSKTATVLHTLSPFKAVPGMADLFQEWSRHSHVRFHYVSGGPDQMEKPMEKFLDSAGFPEGSLDLRDVSLKDKKSAADWRGGNPCHYKIVKVGKILKDFPDRRFCLIGDAGEGDKRALLWLANEYPDRVKWVFIRRLPKNIQEDFVDPKRYADDDRCLKSDPPVPRTVVYREFRSPAELEKVMLER